MGCMGLSQTACAPKQSRTGTEMEEAAQASDAFDSFVIDRELYLAATKPGTLVQSSALSVSELEEHRAPYGDSLELSGDLLSLSLPSGLLSLEHAPESTGQWNMPAPGSAEERRLAAMHTKEALCSAGETVCITSPYGNRNTGIPGASTNHKGVDIGAASGSDILAAASGTVTISTYSVSAGNYIMIDHGGGVSTVYMHCSSRLVRSP